MDSGLRLYRLHVGLGLLGAVALVLAAVGSLRAVDLHMPSLEALLVACRRAVLPEVTFTSMAVLAVGSLAAGALALGVRAAMRELRASRRLTRSLRHAEPRAALPAAVAVVDDARGWAFCAGLIRPRAYVSSAAVALLSHDELQAVVAHEAHHVRRRDPLRLACARVLSEALFFVPALRRLGERYAALAELAADEAAVRVSGGDPQPLAAALLAFDEHPRLGAVGIAPERVDHLLGEPPRLQLPLGLIALGVLAIAALGAAAVRTSQLAAHSQVDVSTLAAQACMVAMAALPLVAGAAMLLGGRRLRRR